MTKALKKFSKNLVGGETVPFNVPKPVVNILFYTDDDGAFGVVDDSNSDFGIGMLRGLIESNTPSFVDINITFLNRHENKFLTRQRLGKLDEVWFFGTRLSNLPDESLNELDAEEVKDLENWMKAGGVLMTGDHSNPKDTDADASLNDLLNLGRAIGHKVPRAGQLRRWEGPPGKDRVPPGEHQALLGADRGRLVRDHLPGNYNTHQPPDPPFGNIETVSPMDNDNTPQRLILKKYLVSSSLPWFSTTYRPHPLFCGKAGPIDVFPDHMHEGHLIIPEPLDGAWPARPDGSKPGPEIIAQGTDKRNGAIYGMVSAYNGDLAGVGRIVADSTWHHYFNFNLSGFDANVLAKLADYYVNLAIWLAPTSRREQMRSRIFWDMSRDPHVLEVRGGNLFTIGQTAFNIFGNTCQSADLLFSLIEQQVMFTSDTSALPPEELLLGGIIDQYHRAFDGSRKSKRFPKPQELIDLGVKRAFEVYDAELDRACNASRKGYEILFPKTKNKEGKPKSTR